MMESREAWEERLAEALSRPVPPSAEGGGWPRPDVLTPAAVLVPLLWRDEGVTVLLTRRTAHLSSHAGQISFPGGKLDAGETPLDAALREAEEEVGLARADVRVLAVMEPYPTVTGYCITPVVGVLQPPLSLTPSEQEVAEVFEVPLARVCELAAYQRHEYEKDGQRGFYYALRYGSYFIWGATAAMLRQLALRLS